ncbi:MAG: ATP-binding protein [Ignavibacteriales bacterium]|nr:ATP-binding protein [Ignavibacteriales bacterium]
MPNPNEAVPQASQAGTTKLTILLVDDVPENLELLEDVLQENGFGTMTASSGQEALEQLRQHEVHLVVSDAMMPKMDGLELCTFVRKDQRTASIPFIIYTGDYLDKEDEELARSIGVDRYVEKMGGVDVLVDVVKGIVRERYGYDTGGSTLESQHLDDHIFLEKHHAIVVKKLEQKMNELEMFAQTLSRKNRELQISEARYRGLFEQASVAIYVLMSDTDKVVDVNKEGLDLLGYTRDELIAMSSFPFEASELATLSTLRNPDGYFGEAMLKDKDGARLHVEISAGPFVRGVDSKVLMFVRDVTEQKKIREKLMLAEKMSLMGTLASGIAHEIRNPLAAVSLNLQYLQEKTQEGTPVQGAVLTALEGAKRIEKVIDNTLGLARMTPPKIREESVNDIVDQALTFVKLNVQQKGLELVTVLGEELPFVHVDSRQIQQVLINLIQNAVDACPQGSAITLKTYCIEETLQLVEGVPAERSVVLSIRDTGIGIPPERMADLFEPLRTTKPGGTGLGLALSKRILDRHNAEIRIESAEGGGTMVRLIFPTQIHIER